MTSQPAYPGYATPTFTREGSDWDVTATPWGRRVGAVSNFGPVGWVAVDHRGLYVGLFPDKQAAGEALVKHAGYEVL